MPVRADDKIMVGDRKFETAYERMGRTWLGLGNLRSACWFVGLEPGGSEPADWPERWVRRFGAAEVIDPRGDTADPNTLALFGPAAKLQKTWAALIRLRLAYAGEAADGASCLAYQREKFVSSDGGEAALELSSYEARNLQVETPRERYREARIKRIRELIAKCRPEIVVCYGLSSRSYFEVLCGGPFDRDGFRWLDKTLCALTTHPTPRFRPASSPQYWIDLGAEMKQRRHAQCGGQ